MDKEQEVLHLQLRGMVEDYITETNAPFTVDEVLDAVTVMFPLVDDKDDSVSGFFGYDVAPSSAYGPVAVIRMVYISPRKRQSFKKVALSIFQFLKDQGYETVEVHASGKVNNWMKKQLSSRPYTYIHMNKVDEYIRRLT